MSDVRLKISPPWVVYAKKLSAIFDEDPQIAFNVNFSSANPTVVLSTNNGEKAAAIAKLLPDEKEFGNVKMSITIDCDKMSNRAFETPQELFETAFDGNPVFAYTVAPAAEGYWFIDFCYVCFANTVVQFFCDNLNDPHGVISTLYQDIAEEIFADADIPGNVHYCTAIERKLGVPLGEWP
jgi:hypothetical protein